MIGYQIRLMHDDGSLALNYVATCLSDDHARRMADEMLTSDIGKVEVWREFECVHRGRSQSALQ